MDELLAAAASAMNAPAEMVERSATARAKAEGTTVEAVLAGWAGVEAPAGGAAPAAEATAPAEAAPTPAPTPAPKADLPPPTPEEAIGEAAVIRLAAHLRSLPESMIRRSAEARAEVSGSTYEAVLAEWAGVPIDQVTAEAPDAVESAPAPAPAAEAAPAAPAAAAPAAAAPADDAALLAAAAEKMGMPESMVKRSAGARAKAQNTTVEAVLAEWAGVEAPAAAAPSAAPAADAPAAPAAAAAADDAAPSTPDVEVLGEPDDAPVKAAVPAEPDPFEPEEVAIAAGALPRWLAALFVFIPAFAIAYALFLPNGPNCGDAGSLAVDPVTGVAVNCDLSEFGAEVADFFSIGLETYNGIGCVACHGAGGGGVANFPAFTGGELLSTFPEGQCDAQIEWIALGTAGWPDATYGATNKPVGGSGAVMPGFEGTLTAEEIAAVTLYERVAFGGQDLEAALVDCGLSSGEEGGDAAMEGMEG